VTGAMAVNTWDVIEDLRALIHEGAVVPADRLIDVDVPLSGLVTSSAGTTP
jgi:hypothetical protein